jgi:putative MATE family efflux protein
LWFDPASRELLQRIWKLTWPIVASNLLDLAVTLIELRLVRPFGPAATAAIGVSRPVILLLEAMALAVTSGVIALVSQGVGARSGRPAGKTPRPQVEPDEVVRHSVALVLLMSLPTTLVGYGLSGPLLAALQVSAPTRLLGEPYLRVYFLGVASSWGYLVGTALFRGAGNVWTPLKIALVVSVGQIGLDYLLIYGAGPLPAFEVQGAALGAVIARSGGVALFLFLLLRGDEPLRLRRPASGWWPLDHMLLAYILRIGVPMALANVLRHGSRVVYLAIAGASTLHEALQAALGLALQIRLLGVLIALAFQTATATLVGQALGRREPAHAEETGRRSVQLLGLLMGVLTVVLTLCAEPIAAWFLSDPQAATLAAQAIRWFSLAQLFSNLSIGLQGALMGAGDTLPAMHYTLIGEWGVMLPAAYLFVRLDYVPDGLLASWVLAPMLTLFLMQRRFRGGRWKTLPKILD